MTPLRDPDHGYLKHSTAALSGTDHARANGPFYLRCSMATGFLTIPRSPSSAKGKILNPNSLLSLLEGDLGLSLKCPRIEATRFATSLISTGAGRSRGSCGKAGHRGRALRVKQSPERMSTQGSKLTWANSLGNTTTFGKAPNCVAIFYFAVCIAPQKGGFGEFPLAVLKNDAMYEREHLKKETEHIV